MTVPIPDEAAQKQRIALIAAGSVAAVLVVAGIGWAVLRPHNATVTPRTFTPAEETTASGPATSSAVASALAGEGASGTAGSGTGGGSSAGMRSAKIVFRLGNSLYVANEDGSGAVALKVAESEYALSPDGTSLAVIRGGKLNILTVASGQVTVGSDAEQVAPVWMPDSSAVLYVRAGADGVPAVWRVARDGSGGKLVGPGQGVAVSPNGTAFALLPSEAAGDAPQVTVIPASGAAKKISVSGGEPVAAAVGANRVFISTLSPEGRTAIWTSGLDGSARRELVGAAAANDKATTYGRLLLSPDGQSLAYTTDGDDGYSRIWVVPVSGGSPRQVTARRDGYPLGWTADGSAIVFFEGNSFQGESSALWRSDPDGMHRQMIVSGAIQ